MFQKRPKAPAIPYDPVREVPAVRKSICTGEMTVGFVDKVTGRFRDVMLARDERALEGFRRATGCEKLKEIY
ncbi:MAG: aspartate dehydrogenase [Clostridia bacterium]|nr:aspartate dehydrogenase [Clostridia bacterium]